MTIKELYNIFKATSGISTDSRAIRGGELFVALRGDNFDGNAFAPQALKSGAARALVSSRSEAAAIQDPRILPVEDTLTTLRLLAAWHRRHLGTLKVIGLTGTNGKTTTKELLRAVLGTRYRVYATAGNLNNDIGVPLSILRIPEGTEFAVIEMGASHPDDISSLVEVCQPDYGLITNVGKGHLLGFGDLEGVKRAKGKLYDYLAWHGEAAFVNACDPVLMEMAQRRGLTLIPYGHDASVLPSGEFLSVRKGEMRVETRLVGGYNAANVLAAIAVGEHFGIPPEDAAASIAAYEPGMKRSQLVHTGRNTLIEDLYNANPSSMAAALDSFEAMPAGRKAVMLGEMRELGADSPTEHSALIERLRGMGLELICLVGEEFRAVLPPEHGWLRWFPDSDCLADYLAQRQLCGCTVLIKGSRGVRMEAVIPRL